jgi:hypothetical protein
MTNWKDNPSELDLVYEDLHKAVEGIKQLEKDNTRLHEELLEARAIGNRLIIENAAQSGEIERLRKRVEFVPGYAVRCAALEEAAKVADKHWNGKNAIGEAIRALKEKP